MKATTWVLVSIGGVGLMGLAASAADIRDGASKSSGLTPIGGTNRAVEAAQAKSSSRKSNAVAPADLGSPEDLQKLLDQMLQQFRDEQKLKLDEYRKSRKEGQRGSAASEKIQIQEQIRSRVKDPAAIREQFREQIRERLNELNRRFPNRKDVLDAAREQVREQRERAKGE